jgi:hypothetical protein
MRLVCAFPRSADCSSLMATKGTTVTAAGAGSNDGVGASGGSARRPVSGSGGLLASVGHNTRAPSVWLLAPCCLSSQLFTKPPPAPRRLAATPQGEAAWICAHLWRRWWGWHQSCCHNQSMPHPPCSTLAL